MYLARVLGNMISTDKYAAFEGRKMLIVQKLGLDQKPVGPSTMAIDYVGAGEGDLVLVGAAPGLASTVFGIPKAPMRELVMGIIDSVDSSGEFKKFGNSVPPAGEPEPDREKPPE
jgi:ethanolamine utilization protein EutN